jgi:ribonuclease P protein component
MCGAVKRGAVETISASGEIDRLFSEGQRAGTPALLVLALRTPEARGPGGRVLFVAGKKLGGAVLRNRCKRVERAAAVRAGAPWPGWDVALIARARTSWVSPEELDAALDQGLRKLGVKT